MPNRVADINIFKLPFADTQIRNFGISESLSHIFIKASIEGGMLQCSLRSRPIVIRRRIVNPIRHPREFRRNSIVAESIAKPGTEAPEPIQEETFKDIPSRVCLIPGFLDVNVDDRKR